MEELLYEIYGYGIPRLLGNRKLLEKSIGLWHTGWHGNKWCMICSILDVDWKSDQ